MGQDPSFKLDTHSKMWRIYLRIDRLAKRGTMVASVRYSNNRLMHKETKWKGRFVIVVKQHETTIDGEGAKKRRVLTKTILLFAK